MMFGYACRDTDNYMPLPLEISHMLLRELAAIRRENTVMNYLRPDAKSQVTIEYNDDNTPRRIDAIVVSTQHDDFVKPKDASKAAKQAADEVMLARIKKDIITILIPRVMKKLPKRTQELFGKSIKYHINPTGTFVIGGPHGDTGLTGRKIIVDTYGGKGAHGGGAFSGKDPSKVDRSAAYAARHVAKHLVAAGVCDEVLVQVAYAIGVARPMNVTVYTEGTGVIPDDKIAALVNEHFDLRPKGIIQMLDLLRPIYEKTAAYGHFGREEPEFTWERTDKAQALRAAAGL
jgi:S-adenosylmethionine synthetase